MNETAFVTPEIEAILNQPQQRFDSETLRWAFQPATPNVTFSTLLVNIPSGHMPYGTPVPLISFTRSIENPSMDQEADRYKDVRITAEQASGEIATKLVGKGYREFEFGNTNAAEVMRWFSVVHPNLSEIGMSCPFNEEEDFEPRQICPSCLYEWIVGTAEGDLEKFVSFQERIGEAVSNRSISPAKAQEYRDLLKSSLEEYLTTSQKEWGKILETYNSSKEGNGKIAPAEHFMRKNIHQIRPQDRDFYKSQQMGEAIAEKLGEFTHVQQNFTPEVLATVVSQTVAATLIQMGVVQPPAQQTAVAAEKPAKTAKTAKTIQPPAAKPEDIKESENVN